jgi:deazaflavin-dependent oxidoreductase (nitroreductase family)
VLSRNDEVEEMEDPQFCYVTTRGRVTGRPHEIEIWFAREPDASTIYMLSDVADRSDWVKNMRADPAVTVRIGEEAFVGTARILDPATKEDAVARRLVQDKYARRGQELTNWLREALPIAIDSRPLAT